MKKIVSFFRSMRFGIILLILVMACSLAGSLVPQDRAAAWYIENYPSNIGALVVGLGAHRLFGTWYFVSLISLLVLNLLLCTLVRFGHIAKTKESALQSTAKLQNGYELNTEQAAKLQIWLKNKRFKSRVAENSEGVAVFIKNVLGYYGSFVVHLSLLLILVFGGLVLKLSTVADYNINPNETLILEDGTQLTLDSFRIADELGRTDYTSSIRVRSLEGYESGQKEIRVNHPFTFRSNKYYQHTFGTCGSITALNTTTGGWDVFYLTERSFLSSGTGLGIWYEALFPGYVIDENGNIAPLISASPIYPDPLYYVLVSDENGRHPRFVLPGETISIADIEFTFNEPAHFSGIRIKRIPHPFMEALFASFALMIIGFWLCFFHMPAIVAVGSGSYKTGGLHSGVQLDIESYLLGANSEIN